jgi:hypothetical protein
MAVVTPRRGWRVTLRWRIVVRPFPSVFGAVVAVVIAAVVAAVIAAVIAVPLLRPSCWLVLSDAGALIAVRPYLDVLSFLK